MVVVVLMDGKRLQIPEGEAAVRRGHGVSVFDATGKEIYAHYLPVSAVYVNDRKIEPI